MVVVRQNDSPRLAPPQPTIREQQHAPVGDILPLVTVVHFFVVRVRALAGLLLLVRLGPLDVHLDGLVPGAGRVRGLLLLRHAGPFVRSGPERTFMRVPRRHLVHLVHQTDVHLAIAHVDRAPVLEPVGGDHGRLVLDVGEVTLVVGPFRLGTRRQPLPPVLVVPARDEFPPPAQRRLLLVHVLRMPLHATPRRLPEDSRRVFPVVFVRRRPRVVSAQHRDARERVVPAVPEGVERVDLPGVLLPLGQVRREVQREPLHDVPMAGIRLEVGREGTLVLAALLHDEEG